jgi:hypothetical protein
MWPRAASGRIRSQPILVLARIGRVFDGCSKQPSWSSWRSARMSRPGLSPCARAQRRVGTLPGKSRTSPPVSLTSAATTARSESFTTSPGNGFCCGAVFHHAALDRGGPRKPRLQCCKRRLVDQSTLFQCPPRPVLVSDRDGGNVWCRRCHILPTHRHLGSCLSRTRARPDASSSGASSECNIG